MTTHILKVQTQFWDALVSGAKPFEYRYNDRGYKVGDMLSLRRYDNQLGMTGQETLRKVSYIQTSEDMPTLSKDHVILGLEHETVLPFEAGYRAALEYAESEGWHCREDGGSLPDKLEKSVLAGNAWISWLAKRS